MSSSAPESPNLIVVVASWIVASALLAFSFLAVFAVLTVPPDHAGYAPRFVTAEISSLLKNAAVDGQAILLPAVKTLGHYSDRGPKYAFRVFSSDGRLLASRNGALFSNFQDHGVTRTGTRTAWAMTHAGRPLWMAGGEARVVDGQPLQIEVATLGDPAWRRGSVFFQNALFEKLSGQFFALLLMSALTVFFVQRVLGNLRRRAKQENNVPFEDGNHSSEIALEGREGVQSGVRAMRDVSVESAGRGALGEDLSEVMHETRSSLALILLQLNKLPKEAAFEIEKDVASIASSIEKMSALVKRIL